AVGVSFGPRSLDLSIEYAYGEFALGFQRYESAHHLRAAASWTIDRWILSAGYQGLIGIFHPAEATGFSGMRHGASIAFSRRIGSNLSAGIGYSVVRDHADSESLRFLEHGPIALARLAIGTNFRLSFDASAALRGYDAAAPDFDVARSDTAF